MANTFNFDEWLQPFKGESTKTLKARYTKAYRNIQRRLATFAKPKYGDIAGSRLGTEAIKAAKSYVKPSQVTDREELEKLIISAEHFLSLKTRSVQGLRIIRAQTIRSLNQKGYTFVNKSNIEQFGAFMEEWRKTFGEKPGSPTPSEMQSVQKALKKLTPEEVRQAFANYVKTGVLAKTISPVRR